MFAGVSSPVGFIDYFDNIMPVQKARARYFLKGASGGGKSTFMKKVVTEIERRGLDAELFHCANDAQSLDAVAVDALGLCIMDATAPHSRDPQIPVATDTIIDFARFLDRGKLAAHKSIIEGLLHDKKILADKAARYFAAVGKIFAAERIAGEAALKETELENLVNGQAKNFAGHKILRCKGYNDRKLFLNAVTPEGLVSFADDFFADCTVHGLHTVESIGANRFLASLQKKFNNQGIETESFYNPLDPEKIEYLHLPQLKHAFIAIGGIFEYRGKIDERIDLSPCINTAMFNRIKMDIEHDSELFDMLLEKVMDAMLDTKAIHAKIENIYITAMDFDRVDEMTEKFIKAL